MFPGDADFGLENYWNLPYSYVILALSRGITAYRKERYYSELGTAQIAAILSNQNRQKNSDKFHQVIDFCFFRDREDEGDIPDSYYGSAAVHLVKKGVMPQWALFCFKQLQDCADKNYVPAYPALIAKDCLLLHPRREGDSWFGMMIACESAGGQTREFKDCNNQTFMLNVPKVGTKFVAEEGIILTNASSSATRPASR